MKNKKNEYLLAFMISMIFCYCGLSFINLSFNPHDWGELDRSAYILIGVPISLLMSFVINEERD